ncbi:craniofacial development protein 2 [Plakobranchus ocellatus]|uniref:Craniofacial development protein 2 n=1 Tax=Plakobranchus ocellatus TaxID=259542 RepID=A0AAV4DTY8_9GAST|nr:craniofacial development protein 2 [Plakobranchus ocellatus]
MTDSLNYDTQKTKQVNATTKSAVKLKLRMAGTYNYTLASLKADYHSQFLQLVQATFTNIGREYFIEIPKKDPQEEQEHPGSLYYFMIQVPVTDTAKARSIRDPDTKYYVNRPGLNITLPPNSLIVDVEKINVSAIMFRTSCRYFSGFEWRGDDRCEAQIHVVKDMYKPQSPEQYLVCICTGALPGSGTNKRVSFLLVGEFGSLQTVTPEGRFCFSDHETLSSPLISYGVSKTLASAVTSLSSPGRTHNSSTNFNLLQETGSEIWFLMSSDLEIGHVVGVTVNYDRNMCGTELYPWQLRHNDYDEVVILNNGDGKDDEGGENDDDIGRDDHKGTKLFSSSNSSVKQLLKVLGTVVLEIERMGLSLKKTECMVISKKSSNPKCNLVRKGEQMKHVSKFKYLGYLITSDGRCTSEISKRIVMAKDTFQKMKPIMANRNKSVDSIEPSFARHSIQKEDDGTFSIVEPTSLRSSLGTASEASKSPGGSVVKSETATDGMLKTSAEPKETTTEQPVKGKAKSQLLQGVSEVLVEDINKNQDDSGLDYGHENYQRNCSSSQSNVSCSLSGFTHLPRRVKNTSKKLRLNSEKDKTDLVGRENLDGEQSDICQSRSCGSQRSVSDVNVLNTDEQGLSTAALCPIRPISDDNTTVKRLEIVSFSHPTYRECTKRYNMGPSRLPQPHFSSFRFSKGASYFDKLMKNHNLISGQRFLHERSTDVHNSPDRNYSISDLTADHNRLRCLRATFKTVSADEDACLSSDTNTLSDVSHGWSETDRDTFKTRFLHGGNRMQADNGTKCLLSVTAVGKCLCCIFRFLLLITTCMSRITRYRKENSLAGIRLDELYTPPNLNRTQQEASYSMRRINTVRQECQGQNHKATRDSCCENWTINFDTNYSARDQVENREKLLKGSSVDETDTLGETPLSGPRDRKGHYKSPTERVHHSYRYEIFKFCDIASFTIVPSAIDSHIHLADGQIKSLEFLIE